MSNLKELIKTVEEQKEQLQRYEKRLRDVVVAYKSLQKEKKALESSLKVLSNVSASTENYVKSQSGELSESSRAAQPEPDDDNASDKTTQLQEKVATLTAAMTTFNEERSRMESNFQANTRELKQEKELLMGQRHKEMLEWETQKSKLVEQIADLRKKLRGQQMDRDKEQNDHAVMLRELQMLVALERSSKEKVENQLDELQHNLDQRTPVEKQCEEYKKKIRMMSSELQTVRETLKLAEEKAQMPQPLLLKLQQEMAEINAHHSAAIRHEQVRANEAEERLRFLAEASEDRVGSLESKLTELSETVGNYDRERQQDQLAIQKLKERVSQLDTENSALARVAGVKSPEFLPDNNYNSMSHKNDDNSNLDVQGLMEKITKLKGMLKVANKRSEHPVKLEEFLRQEDLLGQDDHLSCKEELHQLKEEFEKYKMRAQSVLKNKSTKDVNVSREADALRSQVADLRLRVRCLTDEIEVRERQGKEAVDELTTTITNLRQRHSQELCRAEADSSARIGELENQMQRQRERTMALLDEKDGEIRLLKMSLGLFKPGIQEARAVGPEGDEAPNEGGPAPPDELSRFLSVVGGRNNEGHLLHYMQEIARKDVEVADLRRCRHQLETGLRELQTAAATREENHAEVADDLRGEIRRLTRNCAREGSNLEYLKNVVLSYMTSSDVNSRRHMLNAIAALLKFSSRELDSVQQYNSAWWWQPKKVDGGVASYTK